MHFPEPLLRGILVRRYKRFLADVAVPDGIVTAHCPNPGSMMGLDKPGFEAWLAPARPGGKLRFGLQMIRPGSAATLVGVNTGLANRLVEEALDAGAIETLAGYPTRRRKVRYGDRSRVDFVLEAPDRPACYVEVKSVTLRRDGGAETGGLAEFPDAVTQRGRRHLDELAAAVRAGARAVMLFVVQRADCDRFAVAHDIDPVYASGLAGARAAGVEIAVHGCTVAPEGIALAGPLDQSQVT